MRKIALVTGSVVVAMLAGCASTPMSMGSTSSYPSTTYQATGVEYGRIVNVEYMPVGTTAPATSNRGILGAVVGGIAGAVLGSTIGGGSGRTAATVLGGVAGAAVGNHIARNQQGVSMDPGYRITMQTDGGAILTYEVPAAGDLRVGDRVRVDNGVIYRA